MPTYNDEATILNAIDSVLNQDYTNWELIIINDGSTDNTDLVVKEYIDLKKDARIKYFKQNNEDQLNAIKNASQYITGNIVYILHSDDEFYNQSVLLNASHVFENENLDAIITRTIPCMNEHGELTKTLKVRKYSNSTNTLSLLMLNEGMNLYMDMTFVRKDVFLSHFTYNYLTWNRPFWANIETNKILKVMSVKFPFFKYRVFSENYINSELGMVNVYNGVLRTFTDLLTVRTIPFWNLQRFCFKVANKIKLPFIVKVLSFNRATKNKFKLINKVLPNDIKHYAYFNAILNFYKNKNDRVFVCPPLNDVEVYRGADMRKFNKLMLSNNMSAFYNNFLNEMSLGFSKIKVDKKDEERIKNILHFLCIQNEVEIIKN